MQLYEIIYYTICFSGLIIGAVALFIYWLAFKREYFDALARYKRLIEETPVEKLNGLYNREFPADFSIEEIRAWMKEKKDDE